ncbi:MAG: TIGR02530 family flagellar biosynthesis protein [Lachnospiraceae bacterium]|nr:TIGR02530 family flagellar biosynthesis protein [Lachnospiraceae bacterium]MEE3460449.1 TIGR02530 family flagellar biosynthesis protein [Lachnospiraceae bacterium]
MILNGERVGARAVLDPVKATPSVNNQKETLKNPGTGSFEDIFREAGRTELRFSRHASERMDQRNMNLSESQKARLSEGTDKARNKGIRESLIMVDNMAFIVNVRNNTVITAVNDSDLKDQVFTNIDGAVIG